MHGRQVSHAAALAGRERAWLVAGPSGSGKSSLLRAGLVAALFASVTLGATAAQAAFKQARDVATKASGRKK